MPASHKSARSAAADSDYNTTDDENLGRGKRKAMSIAVEFSDKENIVQPNKVQKNIVSKISNNKPPKSKPPPCPNFFASKEVPYNATPEQQDFVEEAAPSQSTQVVCGNSPKLDQAVPSAAAQSSSFSIPDNTVVDVESPFYQPDDEYLIAMTNDQETDKMKNIQTWESEFNLESGIEHMPIVIAERDGALVHKSSGPGLSITKDIILDQPIVLATRSTAPSVATHTCLNNSEKSKRSLRLDELPTNCSNPKPCTYIKEYLDRILNFQAHMSINILSIDKRLKAMECKKPDESENDSNVTEELLPLKTIDDVKLFEDLLTKSKDAERDFKKRVVRTCGNSPRDFVQRALKLTFTNGCAVACSWKGFKNHYGIFQSKITNIMKRYKWVQYSGMRAALPGMICAGRDRDGATLVVGRAEHNGDVLPAKAKPEHAVAYVAYNGFEHEKRSFEILMPADFHWIASRNGQVPHGAVESGRTNTGETLYVGRGFQEGTPTVGKVHPSHGCLYVPYGGREVALREYEVLVQM